MKRPGSAGTIQRTRVESFSIKAGRYGAGLQRSQVSSSAAVVAGAAYTLFATSASTSSLLDHDAAAAARDFSLDTAAAGVAAAALMTRQEIATSIRLYN